MKRYVILIILISFAGCTTSRKISRSSNEVKLQNDIKSNEVNSSITNSINTAKALASETKTDEVITIKQPVQSENIELTANFVIDTSASMQGDTALKLVDVTDKNISITVYQNRKTNVLTAKIKTNKATRDVPFSEITISKSTVNKTSEIDTSKTNTIESNYSKSLVDKSKIEIKNKEENIQSESNGIELNYYGIGGVLILVLIILILYSRRK